MLAAWALIPVAAAAGYSADIELVRPWFSPDAAPGVDAPRMGEPGEFSGGVFLQYERDPLVIFEETLDRGAVVRSRQVAQVGASVGVTRSVSARVLLPVAYQWGTEQPSLSAEGLGAGDLWLGARWTLTERSRVALGVRGDAAIPTGAREAWLGEERARASGALLARLSAGGWSLLSDTGITGRSEVATDADFELGSELTSGLCLRYQLWPDRASISAGLVSRAGVRHLGLGGAETASEALAGLTLRARSRLQVDLGVGRGVSDGYGTTSFRGIAGISVMPAADAVVASPPRIRVDYDGLPDVALTEESPQSPQSGEPDGAPGWAEGELARVEGEQIVIRDPIRFEFATANILPESLPVLIEVARLMAADGRILHVLVEGHASDEGSYSYNYDLSNRRARSIFQELIRAGVHPERLSYRGMGEVQPLGEQTLAVDRRVVFHILRVLGPDELAPVYSETAPLPWSGEEASFEPPQIPAPPAPPEIEPEPVFDWESL